jgi:hypothetical protein
MAQGLGSFLVDVVLIFVGVFLTLAAYSRVPLLLKVATLATFRIDPDEPGRTQRGWLFGIGIGPVIIGVLLIVVDKLKALGFI